MMKINEYVDERETLSWLESINEKLPAEYRKAIPESGTEDTYLIAMNKLLDRFNCQFRAVKMLPCMDLRGPVSYMWWFEEYDDLYIPIYEWLINARVIDCLSDYQKELNNFYLVDEWIRMIANANGVEDLIKGANSILTDNDIPRLCINAIDGINAVDGSYTAERVENTQWAFKRA